MMTYTFDTTQFNEPAGSVMTPSQILEFQAKAAQIGIIQLG